MKFSGVFSIVVGLLMFGQWGFFLAAGAVPELQSEPLRIALHLAGELITAVCLIAGGLALLRGNSWGKPLSLVAGGMLAFALSFDEVIVTTFTAGQQTTLPIWMLSELVRPRQRPVTNVVAVFVIAVTFVPILIAYYATRGTETTAGGGK